MHHRLRASRRRRESAQRLHKDKGEAYVFVGWRTQQLECGVHAMVGEDVLGLSKAFGENDHGVSAIKCTHAKAKRATCIHAYSV